LLQVIAVAGGGAIGAVLRFWMSGWVYKQFGSDFPYGTLAVNVSGSLLMGLLYVLFVERFDFDPVWRAILLIGGLGAFTTFSSYSIETLNLIEGGEFLKAMLNTVLSIVLCMVAVWGGVIIGRQI